MSIQSFQLCEMHHILYVGYSKMDQWMTGCVKRKTNKKLNEVKYHHQRQMSHIPFQVKTP